jgi:hypothetical protein
MYTRASMSSGTYEKRSEDETFAQMELSWWLVPQIWLLQRDKDLGPVSVVEASSGQILLVSGSR